MAAQTEILRLLELRKGSHDWHRWGPYLSERAWGTVREDYGDKEDPWTYFPHDHASRRAFRWGEDGIAGISDEQQYLCFSFSFWNGKDAILKERLYGMNAWEGNHGEDVKELYFYTDGLPSHSWMRYLYKYPQSAFPYQQLVEENARRSKLEPEFEIEETGVFDAQRYFDIEVTYAKADVNDVVIECRVHNRSAQAAELFILPTLWFRNTWAWGYPNGPDGAVPKKPQIRRERSSSEQYALRASHPVLGNYWFYADRDAEIVVTENDTNNEYCFGAKNKKKYLKDAFHRYLIHGEKAAVAPSFTGTKAAYIIPLVIEGQQSETIRLRLLDRKLGAPFDNAEETITLRQTEADAFYAAKTAQMPAEHALLYRQACAGMLWSKQFYYYDVEQWLDGDPIKSRTRPRKRNRDWRHLRNADVISMPDKWEFPWFAAWDLAFHCLPLSALDEDFAKRQLKLFTREWYLHPNGELPAYEWSFSDVNPPVHAWAALEVFRRQKSETSRGDLEFLETLFHKMLLNFTCWVNRRDAEGRNVFQGGFLGLDNIGVFDRSKGLDSETNLIQADATSWMASYCISMLEIALELSAFLPVYQDTASKFAEHFFRIAHSMMGGESKEFALWDEHDGFFYDVMMNEDGSRVPLKLRSLVGLIPLTAVCTIPVSKIYSIPYFHRRLRWLLKNKPHLVASANGIDPDRISEPITLSLVSREQLRRILERMFDENEFLSTYGIRSLSKCHGEQPYELQLGSAKMSVSYEPGESTTYMFGGNSNWRGPIWIPINFLLIEALDKYHQAYGDSFTIEVPRGSGRQMTLREAAQELRARLLRLFEQEESGLRPFARANKLFMQDEHFKDLLLFHEHFHADNGRGLGASHQTGWTGLVVNILEDYHRNRQR